MSLVCIVVVAGKLVMRLVVVVVEVVGQEEVVTGIHCYGLEQLAVA